MRQLTLYLLFSVIAMGQNSVADEGKQVIEERKEVIKEGEQVLNNEKDELQEPATETDEILFREDVVIDSGEVVHKNITIIGGNFTVYGTVNGKVTLYGGDAYLKSGSVLNGEIATIGGNLYTDPGATNRGKVIESNLQEGLIYRETDSEDKIQGRTEFNLDRRSKRNRKSWIHPKWPMFQYNRNEGLVFTPFNARWDRASHSSFRVTWSLGVRWHQGYRPDYLGRATLEKSFFTQRNILVYTSIFKESRTDDSYRLSRNENSMAGILGRQDFLDRWEEKGWELGLALDFAPFTRLKVRTVSAEQDTFLLLDLWSLFEKERALRPNLNVDNKQVNYYEITLASRTPRYNALTSGAALYVQSEFIQTSEDTASVFGMDTRKAIKRNFGFVTLNWEFSEGLVFRTRLMGGASQSQLPEYRHFGIGGLGSVAAQSYKSQSGNMMAQLNLALLITPEFINDDWLVTLFADGGHAWMKEDYKFDFDSIKQKGISSAGIGVGDTDDDGLDWMVNIAKPLNKKGPYETTIRLGYRF